MWGGLLANAETPELVVSEQIELGHDPLYHPIVLSSDFSANQTHSPP